MPILAFYAYIFFEAKGEREKKNVIFFIDSRAM